MTNFMNRQSFEQMFSLVNKYKNCGLTVEIEFDRFGLILRGIWILSLSRHEIMHFNRRYSWTGLNEMPEEIVLEYLIDEFKKEFEAKISNEESEE